MLKEVNSTEFKDLAGKGLVLADFFSTTCGPCKMLGFVLKDVEKEFGDDLTILKVEQRADRRVRRGRLSHLDSFKGRD